MVTAESTSPTTKAATIAAEPRFTPVARIVDPAVADETELEDEPLFAEPAYEPRKPRGGFLSIFGGRPRYEAQPAPAPSRLNRRAAEPSRGSAIRRTSLSPPRGPNDEGHVREMQIPGHAVRRRRPAVFRSTCERTRALEAELGRELECARAARSEDALRTLLRRNRVAARPVPIPAKHAC